jgi:hypothetical protein
MLLRLAVTDVRGDECSCPATRIVALVKRSDWPCAPGAVSPRWGLRRGRYFRLNSLLLAAGALSGPLARRVH